MVWVPNGCNLWENDYGFVAKQYDEDIDSVKLPDARADWR
jgi:hypothetical protein